MNPPVVAFFCEVTQNDWQVVETVLDKGKISNRVVDLEPSGTRVIFTNAGKQQSAFQ